MRSMFSGVAGLRVHQSKMDVISNNISNINTIGFKRGTVSFKESFSQTLSSASSASDGRGGLNPQQIGMGSNVGVISTVMGQGAAQRTDYGSDLMINGDGFFIVQDPTGFSFTRAGAFEVDAKGNLVDANGFKVSGWKAIEDPLNPGTQKVVQDRVTPINIYEGDNLYYPAKSTTSVGFSGNLNMTTNSTQNSTFSFYDSIGNKYTVNATFTHNPAAGNWDFAMNPNVSINGGTPQAMDGLNVTATLTFNNGILQMTPPTLAIANIGFPGGVNPYNSTFANPLTIDFSGLTQFNSKVTVTSETKDGNTAGNMTGYGIDADGVIRGTYSNGETKILYQVALAKFKNPGGLEKYGNNLYKDTANSGEFDGVGVSAGAMGSKIQSGALEMSNVDLSYEFSEMIITQRGFQANSRIISTSDDMIQELVNIKR